MLAMAKAAEVPLTIDDIQAISSTTPFLADLRPRYLFSTRPFFMTVIVCIFMFIKYYIRIHKIVVNTSWKIYMTWVVLLLY